MSDSLLVVKNIKAGYGEVQVLGISIFQLKEVLFHVLSDLMAPVKQLY